MFNSHSQTLKDISIQTEEKDCSGSSQDQGYNLQVLVKLSNGK